MAKKPEGTAAGTAATPAAEETQTQQQQQPPAPSDDEKLKAAAAEAEAKAKAEAEAKAKADAEAKAAEEAAKAKASGEQSQSEERPQPGDAIVDVKVEDTFLQAVQAQRRLAHEEKRFPDEAAFQRLELCTVELRNALPDALAAANRGRHELLCQVLERMMENLK